MVGVKREKLSLDSPHVHGLHRICRTFLLHEPGSEEEKTPRKRHADPQPEKALMGEGAVVSLQFRCRNDPGVDQRVVVGKRQVFNLKRAVEPSRMKL